MAPRFSVPQGAVVLLDGDCGLCSKLGAFLATRISSQHLRLIARQSPEGSRLIETYFPLHNAPDSVLVIDKNCVLYGSDAVLRIAQFLPTPWPLLYHLRVIPHPLRDALYRIIARYRRRLFPPPQRCPIR